MKVKRGHRRIILKGVERMMSSEAAAYNTQHRASLSGMPGNVMMPGGFPARHRTSSLTSPQELAMFTMQNTFFPQAAFAGSQSSAIPGGRKSSIIAPGKKKANEETKEKKPRGRPSKKTSVVSIKPTENKLFGKMSIPSEGMQASFPIYRNSVDGGSPYKDKMMGKMTFNGPYSSGSFPIKQYDPKAASKSPDKTSQKKGVGVKRKSPAKRAVGGAVNAKKAVTGKKATPKAKASSTKSTPRKTRGSQPSTPSPNKKKSPSSTRKSKRT